MELSGQVYFVLAIMVLVGAASSLKPRWGWLFDLASHFRILWSIGLIVIALLSLWFSTWWITFVSFLLLGAIAYSLRLYWKRSAESECAGNTSLTLYNVRMRNRNYDRALQYIRARDSDLIAFVEVDEAWLEALSVLRPEYPYTAQLPHPNSYGLAVFSRFEILDWKGSRLQASDVDHLEVLVRIQHQTLALVIAHLPPPFTPAEMDKRDKRLAQLGEVMGTLERPGLLLGDFNASPWSPPVQELEKQFGLRSFQKVCGLAPTWPAQAPFGRIPIDHVMAIGDGIKFYHAEVGPRLGSDHLPVTLDLKLKL